MCGAMGWCVAPRQAVQIVWVDRIGDQVLNSCPATKRIDHRPTLSLALTLYQLGLIYLA